jgi:hypothetical protein
MDHLLALLGSCDPFHIDRGGAYLYISIKRTQVGCGNPAPDLEAHLSYGFICTPSSNADHKIPRLNGVAAPCESKGSGA